MSLIDRAVAIEAILMRRILEKGGFPTLTENEQLYRENRMYRNAYNAGTREIYNRLALDPTTSLTTPSHITKIAEELSRIENNEERNAALSGTVRRLTSQFFN